MINPTLQETEIPIYPTPIIIDGQDGSGKGTVANILAERCAEEGSNVIKVAYPVYELPWGQFLKHLLTVDDEDLSIEDKMLVYALNRLETVPSTEAAVQNFQREGKPINIIYDRFITSNALTIAYYAAAKSRPEIITPDSISALYRYMLDIDDSFIRSLNLENWSVWIPLLHQDETIKRMTHDTTRQMLDKHERVDVQETAANIYRIMATLGSRINTFDQYLPNENRNMTPNEIAETIMPGKFAAEARRSNHGKILELQPRVDDVDIGLVTDLLDYFGSTKLKSFNPY